MKICAAAFEHIFFLRIFLFFFKERAAASERYQEKCASERKCATAS